MQLTILFLLITVAVSAQTKPSWIYDMKDKPFFDSRESDWYRTNGTGATADLSSGGAKIITLSRCPFGLAVGNTVTIDQGVGTAETQALTAVSCSGGAASGTIGLTTANPHTGAWRVKSSSLGRQEAGAQMSNLSWGDLVNRSVTTQPAFDYEYISILLNNHDYRNNANVPRGGGLSTGAVMLLGWTTPTNAECPTCGVGNEQSALILSMTHMNTVTPATSLIMKQNPGVANWNGIWGFNCNMANDGFANNTTGMLFCGEMNIGIDNAATDQPTPGNVNQIIGLAITESSGAAAIAKRATAAIFLSSSGDHNFHNGIWIDSNNSAADDMDKGIRLGGKMSIPIDLTATTGQDFNGSIVFPNSSTGGIAIKNNSGSEKPVLFVSTGTAVTVLASANSGIQFNSGAGAQLGTFDEAGGFTPTVVTFSAIGTVVNGRIKYCSDCTVTSGADNTCAGSGTGALVIGLNSIWRCFNAQN